MSVLAILFVIAIIRYEHGIDFYSGAVLFGIATAIASNLWYLIERPHSSDGKSSARLDSFDFGWTPKKQT